MPKCALLSLLLLTQSLTGQAVLDPPLGLKWGDSPERLLSWADHNRLDISIQLPAEARDRRIIRLERPTGMIPESGASAVEGRFLRGRLIEVALHFNAGNQGAAEVERRFNELKRQLAAEHGPLTANQQERSLDDDFATRTLSFHKEPVRGLFLLLAYTEIEDLLRKQADARFSLIYRNDNLRRQLDPESD